MKRTILSAIFAAAILFAPSQAHAQGAGCTDPPWIEIDIWVDWAGVHAFGKTDSLSWNNFACNNWSGSVAVDVIVYGIGSNLGGWDYNSITRWVTAGGNFYGVYTVATAHWKNGTFYGYQQDTYDRPDPTSCPQGGVWDPEAQQCVSPIIIQLGNGNAYRMTSVSEGVLFDIDADGILDQVSWTEADSEQAFLALDRNDNGVIDDGSELFGNFTVPGASNGFAALADIEVNTGDGYLDENDLLFPKLLLWVDRNHNGISESDELEPASNRIEKLGLGYKERRRVDGNGNRFLYESWATLKGVSDQKFRQRKVYDVFLVKQ